MNTHSGVSIWRNADKNTDILAGTARHFFRRFEYLRSGIASEKASMLVITHVFSLNAKMLMQVSSELFVVFSNE